MKRRLKAWKKVSGLLFYGLSLQEHIHHDKVADTSAHHKQMKDLMTSEVPMLGVEDWKFQCVNNSSDGIDDSAG